MRGGAAIDPIYEIGSPIFDEITIKLDKAYYLADEFIIETHNNSSANRYIQSANLDGKSLNKSWFYYKDLVDGGKLILQMGAEPNMGCGSDSSSLPPSMLDE